MRANITTKILHNRSTIHVLDKLQKSSEQHHCNVQTQWTDVSCGTTRGFGTSDQIIRPASVLFSYLKKMTYRIFLDVEQYNVSIGFTVGWLAQNSSRCVESFQECSISFPLQFFFKYSVGVYTTKTMKNDIMPNSKDIPGNFIALHISRGFWDV